MRRIATAAFLAALLSSSALAQPVPGPPPSAGSTAANPSATASDTAVNGSASTYMRSDAAPAIQKGSAAQFGVVEADGSTITASGGVISAAVSKTASQTFSGEQRNAITTLTISTATFTPDNSNNNYKIGLTSACPCTIANPTTTTAGAAGVIEVDQDGTGSRTIGTWGSQYIAPGGVATLTLTTAASAKDFFSYLVLDATHILIVPGGLNASH